MISESVYYMDRGHGVLVTDRQVIIDDRRFDLAQVRDARIANRHSGHVSSLEVGMRAGSVVTLLGAMALKGFAWGQPLAQVVFGVDMLVFTACLVGMLFLGLSDKPRQVVELRRLRGRSVELFECIDKRFADAFVEAVTDAARDCRAGHGGNARAVYRTSKK
jgi:hypothetical protein